VPESRNSDDPLVVLNRMAQSVVEAQRKQHATHLFAYQGKPTTRMLNSAWLRAREKAGLPQVRVHDLKHTYGRRLRAAGMSFEDRQDLLGHRSGRITTHYVRVVGAGGRDHCSSLGGIQGGTRTALAHPIRA